VSSAAVLPAARHASLNPRTWSRQDSSHALRVPQKNHVGKRGVYFISTHTSFRILLSFLRRLVCPLLRPIRSHPANGRRQAHTLRIRNRICGTVWPTCYGHQLMIGIWGAGDGVSSFIRP